MSENELENSEQGNPDAGVAESLTPVNERRNGPPAWMWVGLGVLFILALLVIFVLPAVVSEYELPLERRIETVAAVASNPEPATAISPFEEAQRARQRKEAQDVLAALLERQDELEALEVSEWAGSDYEQALQQASIGDDYYRAQDFELATQSYRESLERLGVIQAAIPAALERLLAEGQAAIQAGEAELAEDRFSLALSLEPQNTEADIGLQRARTLEQVSELLAQADSLAADGEWQQARSLYLEVTNLDGYNERAGQAARAMSERLREQEFARVMSEGYALLEQGEPQQAIAAFQRASNLGVNPEQANAAILQTENEVANARINALRARLFTAEAAERWQDAVALYDDVLSIDPNLLFAQQGKDYASKRAQLDSLLQQAIDNPERFAEDAVYQETLDVYYTGRNLSQPGARLSGQLDELEALLEASQMPLEVTLISDGLTEVTLLREAELGQFERQSLTLKPGRYVAVGSRVGYREVRQEFVVGFGQTPEQVVIQCEERVVSSRR